jgi:hypothetical protein
LDPFRVKRAVTCEADVLKMTTSRPPLHVTIQVDKYAKAAGEDSNPEAAA